MRRALLLAALLLLPGVAGQATSSNAREVSILVYHISPDPLADGPDADPFSGPPSAPLTSTTAARLPVTRFDGIADASDAPEGNPASASAHFQEMRRLLQDRARGGAPLGLTIALGAAPTPTLEYALVGADDARGLAMSAVVFEDAIPFDAPSGVRVHRFVARSEPITLALPNGTAPLALDPAWDAARVGVVVTVRNASDGEVLQSAVAFAGERTVQTTKAVLIEHATATWCEPCAPSDEALALLASQYGFPAPTTARGYDAAPTPLALLGLAGGAAVGILLLRRRRAS